MGVYKYRKFICTLRDFPSTRNAIRDAQIRARWVFGCDVIKGFRRKPHLLVGQIDRKLIGYHVLLSVCYQGSTGRRRPIFSGGNSHVNHLSGGIDSSFTDEVAARVYKRLMSTARYTRLRNLPYSSPVWGVIRCDTDVGEFLGIAKTPAFVRKQGRMCRYGEKWVASIYLAKDSKCL